MNIKTFIVFIIIITISVSLLSCGTLKSAIHVRSDDTIADTRFQNIVDSLENKDKEGLKKMFSPKALKEAKDIDEGIDYIMEFYKGNVKSKERALSRSDSNSDGERTSELKVFYTVTTDKDTYIVFFIEEKVDTKNPDNVGLYMLQIIKESDQNKEFDWGTNIKCAGVYNPDINK